MSASHSTSKVSPVLVFSSVTAWMEPSPRTPRTSAGLQMRTLPCSSSSRASLTERLERAEAVAAVDERDRLVRRVLEAERPVERGVAAADDDAGLVAEDLLAADEVVQALALPGVDVVDLELARLEGAVPCGDDQRPGRERLALVRGEDEDLLAVGADPLEVLDLLAEVDVGPELEALLDAEVDERLALDLRVPGDVVDVLLGIDGRDLAAELSEALDDPHGAVAVPAVVGRSETHRPAADDRDVDDLVLAHAAPRVPGTIAALVAAAGATSAAGVGLHGLCRPPRPWPGRKSRIHRPPARSGC